MSKKQHRSPEELIAETEAKLQRLRLKQIRQSASDNPEVSKLLDARNEIQKELREAKKILGDGPQSAKERIAKHEAWIEKIQESAEEARSTISTAEKEIKQLDEQINETIANLISQESEQEMTAEA